MIHYKGGVRISMLCGAKAMEDYRRKTDQTATISNLLSAKPDRLKEAVERLKNEAAEKRRTHRALTRVLNLKVKQYEAGQKPLLVFETGMTALQIRQFCDQVSLKAVKAETATVFSEDAKDGFITVRAAAHLI